VSEGRIASGARRVDESGPAVCAATDIGLHRANNEDWFHASPDGSVLVVADGLGGLPAGEVASKTAVEAAAAALGGRAAACDDEVAGWELLREAFADADRAVRRAVLDAPERLGMATTLIAALRAHATLYLAHVGDVRGYRLGRRGLERLTNDHTTAWELVEDGVLTELEARSHPYRNSLTRVIGIAGAVDPSFRAVPLAAGDVVLLCSDGLWEPVEPEEIATILGQRSRSVAARTGSLLDRAIAAGGPDNVTALVYQHGL